MDSIVNLISQVGFPIAMCLLMFFQNKNVIEKNTEALNELVKRFDEYGGGDKCGTDY